MYADPSGHFAISALIIGAIADKTAVASFAISTVASFGAGVGSYAIDKSTSGEKINVKEMFMYGGSNCITKCFQFWNWHNLWSK